MSRKSRCWLILALVVLPVLPLAGTAQGEAGKKHALLVGVNRYDHGGFKLLGGAENDATDLGKALREHGWHVTVLTGTEATLQRIVAALEQLTGKRKHDEMIMVGLAGHGLLVGADSYFCPVDAEPKKEKSMLALGDVYETLGDSGAGAKLLLVDACREGMTRGPSKLPKTPEGMGVLMSCSAGQFAFETKDGKHGLFFKRVLEAFEGAKDAQTSDGEVTWARLRAYVTERVPKDVPPGAKQVPHDVSNVADVPALAKPKSAALARTLELDLGGGVKMKLVRIEPGTFLMGSPKDEKERLVNEFQHQVEITKPFYLGVYAVTQAQYRQVMGKNPSYFCADGGGKNQVAGMNTDDFPVEQVSWHDAMAFCEKVSALAALKEKGWQADLPTEAEWEYACRAGTKTVFYYGDSLSSPQANFNGKYPYGGAAVGPYKGRTVEVGSYQANAWGLYDMHGNVWQWCRDWYGEKYYENSDNKDPQGPQKGEWRVLRGGSWSYFAWYCRAAYRNGGGPADRDDDVGFRVAVLPSARTRND